MDKFTVLVKPLWGTVSEVSVSGSDEQDLR